MGAEYDSYHSHHADKESVEEEFEQLQQEYCAEKGDNTYAGHLGIKPGLHFIDTVYPDATAADDYIAEQNDKWEAAWAVPYHRVGQIPTAKGRKLIEARSKINRQMMDFHDNVLVRIKAAKSKTIGCKTCGSSVSRAHLSSCSCPVCGKRGAFLTQTDKKRLESMSDKSDELRRRTVEKKTGKTIGYVIGGLCAS